MSFSWLPLNLDFKLPSLAPPLSLQRRFISFVLKRSLGHLLKPGQLDVVQIDAQIGSGFVEVKDLELDEAAINAYIGGLPVQLLSGSISSVTARIPWPNPFSSTVGLTLSGLHLTFIVSKPLFLSKDEGFSEELAESVISLAENFVNEELTGKEEAQLKESIYADTHGTDVPGSLDTSDQEQGAHITPDDPEGVSLFASLFERLLARFDFDASDTQISLIHPDNTEVSLKLSQIRYFTESPKTDQSEEPNRSGEIRTIEVQGLTTTMKDISPCLRDSQVVEACDPRTPVNENSDSEMDEDTQTMMSQSLLSLPSKPTSGMRRPPSPTLSTISSDSGSSSMYQSAIDTSKAPSRPLSPRPFEKGREDLNERREQPIIAISEPITLCLTTPPFVPIDSMPSDSISEDKGKTKEIYTEKINLNVNIGVIALCIHAQQLNGLIQLANVITSSSLSSNKNKQSPVSEKSERSILERVVLSMRTRGIVLLALCDSPSSTEVSHFYRNPTAPPSITSGYIRLHVDCVEAIFTSQKRASSRLLSRISQTDHAINRAQFASCTISDISIFHFLPYTQCSSSLKQQHSFPILMTDSRLNDSYQISTSQHRIFRHNHPFTEKSKNTPLPRIDLVDWTSERVLEHGANLRTWRTKHVPNYRRNSSGLGAGLVSNAKTQPAISVELLLDSKIPSYLLVDTLPLHTFVDVRSVQTISDFVGIVFTNTNESPATEVPSPVDHSPPARTNNINPPNGLETEENRLERLVLEDLNLDMDYRQAGDTTPTKRVTRPLRRKLKGQAASPSLRVNVLIPLFRVEVRVPVPRNRKPRSGALLLDIHSVSLSNYAQKSINEGPGTRFVEHGFERNNFEDWFSDADNPMPASFEMSRIVVAYADRNDSKATTIVSLGQLNEQDDDADQEDIGFSPMKPMILFRKATSNNDTHFHPQSSALLARFPSMHIVIDKMLLDGIQIWADDLSQWMERFNSRSASGTSTRAEVSRTTSLIGSRYFIQRSESTSTEDGENCESSPGVKNSEFVVQTLLSEVFIRCIIPMGDNLSSPVRHLDVCASDLEAILESKPEGKDEMVVSLNVQDASITENSNTGSHQIITSSSLTLERRRQPIIKFRFRSVSIPGSSAKESKIRVVFYGMRIGLWSDVSWLQDLARFAKAPPETFESVVPSVRTQITLNALECALRITPPTRSSALVLALEDLSLMTDLVGGSQETELQTSILGLAVLLTDDTQSPSVHQHPPPETETEYWIAQGYALLATLNDFNINLRHDTSLPLTDTKVAIGGMLLRIYLCADSITGVASFASDLQSLLRTTDIDEPQLNAKIAREPPKILATSSSTLLRSLDEQAFQRQPVIGPLPDMINDDLPRNLEYLDASFGAAAGLRPFDDEEDEFFPEETGTDTNEVDNIVSRHGGETIKVLHFPIEVIDNYYDTLAPSSLDFASEHGDTSFKVRADNCDIHLLLFDGYDWERTRRAIQDEVKRVKRRLAKIRQLLANGQSYDPNVDEVNTVLFNSVYVGLDQEAEELEREALIAAIDNELEEGSEIASESSWQSFKPGVKNKLEDKQRTILHKKRLNRSRGPSIEFSLRGMSIEYDQYVPNAKLASRLLATIRDFEILDHIKTSTWSTFLTDMRSDSHGNVRETDSNMVRVELQMLRPHGGHTDQEARLKAKLLPLRLHVDQDALDFLKKFFAFKDADAVPSPPPEQEIFFQHVEIFPVDIKLDYKPRRVDYRALKEGKTIELMNFFHFDGAEMTLRHITLKGITGWPRMFDTLNDLWTPDVKANQLVDVISGVSPIRSAVNVGSGVADLVLLPIAQYKKDGRIIRGLQKGTTAFLKSTAMEAIRLGARLATGTQVVLEQTENVLGGQFKGPVTAEALQYPPSGEAVDYNRTSDEEETDPEDLISKYAEQPTNISEGVQSAYKTLSRNIKSAGQTILAVPMEVYERSGKEGPTRAVVRAVPIAVLKPMIGASEAISKTLMGLHNTLDPQSQIETETKYKHR